MLVLAVVARRESSWEHPKSKRESSASPTFPKNRLHVRGIDRSLEQVQYLAICGKNALRGRCPGAWAGLDAGCILNRSKNSRENFDIRHLTLIDLQQPGSGFRSQNEYRTPKLGYTSHLFELS
jgi:hypothetical protein